MSKERRGKISRSTRFCFKGTLCTICLGLEYSTMSLLVIHRYQSSSWDWQINLNSKYSKWSMQKAMQGLKNMQRRTRPFCRHRPFTRCSRFDLHYWHTEHNLTTNRWLFEPPSKCQFSTIFHSYYSKGQAGRDLMHTLRPRYMSCDVMAIQNFHDRTSKHRKTKKKVKSERERERDREGERKRKRKRKRGKTEIVVGRRY